MSRLPPWLIKRTPKSSGQKVIRDVLQDDALHSVCESALCPNRGECFEKRVMTFMILGDICTRGCTFCAVAKGHPHDVDVTEPQRVADAARKLGLKHVVVTSVTRDDIGDGGAGHFLRTAHAVRAALPNATIEALTPDFKGDETAWKTLHAAPLTVFNHNVETVPRLYPVVRPQAVHDRSLRMLRHFKDHTSFVVKSGLMVGLGETEDEVREELTALKHAGCDIVTIGQYLAPSKGHASVQAYINPATFERYAAFGRTLGLEVFAGPWVRSSYCAEETLSKLNRPSAPR